VVAGLTDDVVNTAYAGNPLTAKVFWAPRPDLGDMGNSEGQATGLPAQGDMRAYRLAFETIGFTGEQGTLTMEAMAVESFARPAAVTPAVSWGTGTGAIAFSAAIGGFTLANTVGGEFAVGTATPAAASTQFSLGGTSGLRYVGFKPASGVASGAFALLLQPVSNHLYRFSTTVACVSRTAVPCYRVVTNSQFKATAAANGTVRNISWIDWFAFSDTLGASAGGKNPGFKTAPQTNCPFAPSTTGSVIDSYVYSHNVASTAVGNTVFVPILDVFDLGLYGGTSPWPDANTPMTFSAASWEDLGADF